MSEKNEWQKGLAAEPATPSHSPLSRPKMSRLQMNVLSLDTYSKGMAMHGRSYCNFVALESIQGGHISVSIKCIG